LSLFGPYKKVHHICLSKKEGKCITHEFVDVTLFSNESSNGLKQTNTSKHFIHHSFISISFTSHSLAISWSHVRSSSNSKHAFSPLLRFGKPLGWETLLDSNCLDLVRGENQIRKINFILKDRDIPTGITDLFRSTKGNRAAWNNEPN